MSLNAYDPIDNPDPTNPKTQPRQPDDFWQTVALNPAMYGFTWNPATQSWTRTPAPGVPTNPLAGTNPGGNGGGLPTPGPRSPVQQPGGLTGGILPPATTSTASKIGSILGRIFGVGNILSNYAGNAANGRYAQGQFNLQNAQLDLLRRRFQLDAPGQRMGNAVRGSILSNAQDVEVNHPRANIVRFTGGVRPSILSPQARQLGNLIAQQSLADQQKGDQFAPVDIPDAGWFEKLAGVLGLGSSLVGGYQVGPSILNPPSTQQHAPTQTPTTNQTNAPFMGLMDDVYTPPNPNLRQYYSSQPGYYNPDLFSRVRF